MTGPAFCAGTTCPLFEPVGLDNRHTAQMREDRLADEQQQVMDHKLSVDYMKNTGSGGPSLIGLSG